MATPIDIPQNFSTTLNVPGGIDSSQTSGIILTTVTGLPTDGGILCFDWATSLDTSVAEYIEYTGISGNTLTGVTRGQEGLSAKSHSNGATIVGVISRAHIKRLRDKLTSNDATAIQDPNGNEILKSGYVSSAVNEVTVTNSATGNAPSLAATGGDTNIDLNLISKGSGSIKANGSSLVTASSTDTLTNKTLTSPVVNGGTITDPTTLRMPNNTAITARNAANNANVDVVKLDSSDDLLIRALFGGSRRSDLRIETGQVSITGDGTAVKTASVTFTRAFTAAPRVITSPSSNNTFSSAGYSVSTSGFTASLREINNNNWNSAETLDWIAIGY